MSDIEKKQNSVSIEYDDVERCDPLIQDFKEQELLNTHGGYRKI
jgi:hypothetical protein